MDAQPRFEPSLYPRTYPISRGWKVFLGIVGFVLVVLGLAGLWSFGTEHEVRSTGAMVFLLVLCAGSTLVGGYILLEVLRAGELILTADALRVTGVFYDAVVARGDVSAYQVLSAQGMRLLELHRRTGKKAMIPLFFTVDVAFVAWLEGITNLDVRAYEQSAREVEADIDLGDSPDQRRDGIARARRISRALTFLVWSTGAWVVFYPRPYELAIAVVAALPLLVLWLVWRYRGSFTLEGSEFATVRVDLTGEMVMPGFGLTLRAALDMQLTDLTSLIVPGAFGLALLIGAIVVVEPKLRGRIAKLTLASALLLPYPASVAVHANSLLDRKPPQTFRIAVTSKRISSGKGPNHYLLLPPWGPYAEPNEVSVARDLYERTQTGQNVCVWLYAGALGMPFFVVGEEASCP